MVLYYRAGPCRARVVLVRSEEYHGDAQLARWFGVETGGVEEHFVEGTHESMMREPAVASTATLIETCVDAVLARGEQPLAS
jgi:thioesterase domain-containing protein